MTKLFILYKCLIFSQLSKLETDEPITPFNWTAALLDGHRLAINVEVLSQSSPINVYDFFLFEGNATNWEQDLLEALQRVNTEERHIQE